MTNVKKNEEFYKGVIGNTHLTVDNHFDKWMNKYYYESNKKVYKRYFSKLRIKAAQVLDIGCSHGSYYELWSEMGFKDIIGVDISEERLGEAIIKGYRGFCCNAKELPFSDNSIEFASSNDMLVHVMFDEDKADIFKEVFRVLKPGGYFIFNYAPTKGHGFQNDSELNYCNFRSLDTMVSLLKENTQFKIVDNCTSHFKHRWFKVSHYILPGLQTRFLMPFIDMMNVDALNDEALYSYIIVQKSEDVKV